MITGISNTIPLALLMEVPVCNIDLKQTETSLSREIFVEKLGVQGWKGFSKKGFSKFMPETRQADFMRYLEDTFSGGTL